MSEWKWVPVEPTPVMLAQGQWKQVPSYAPVTDCVNANIKAGEIYKAMLANAPVTPSDELVKAVDELLDYVSTEVNMPPTGKQLVKRLRTARDKVKS